jgi:hypothetical protein
VELLLRQVFPWQKNKYLYYNKFIVNINLFLYNNLL